MSVPKRRVRAEGTYFISSRTWESRKLFIKDEPCQIFVETLLRYRDEGKYMLHAFVVMPEHFHALITPAEAISLERAVQYIKGGSARRIRGERRLAFPVWQRGFSDHRIRDLGDYGAHVRYIEENAVKRSMVSEAREYKWSSASLAFALDDAPQRLKPLE